MAFQKGISGNPRGRPRENAEVKALALAHSVEAVKKLVEHMRGDDKKASISASNSILDRACGKPVQQQQYLNEEGDPTTPRMEIRFINGPLASKSDEPK